MWTTNPIHPQIVDNDIQANNSYNEIIFFLHKDVDEKTIIAEVDVDERDYYRGSLVGLVTLLNAIRITNSPRGMTEYPGYIRLAWMLPYTLLPYLIEKFDGNPKHILCHLKREQYANERIAKP